MVKIYESPDGGNTVYERDTETGDRTCIQTPNIPDWYIDSRTFFDIISKAQDGNKTLQNILKELILVYELSREQDG